MIELKAPVKGFAGVDAEIDRIEIMSIVYNKHRGREPHLDIGVEVGKWIEAETEVIPVEHPGWKMVDGEDGAPPSRVCHECEGIETWVEKAAEESLVKMVATSIGELVKETAKPEIGQWSGDHDMDACLAGREPETRVICEAHIEWLGGTSIIVRGEQLRDIGLATLEACVGELILRMGESK